MKKTAIDYVLGMFKKPEPVKAEPKAEPKRRKRKVKA
jgi:hypothetical protein